MVNFDQIGVFVPIDVVDIFAGPGGLGEGFSTLKDNTDARVFNIVNSVEEKEFECQTLRLRAFYRRLVDLGHYESYLKYLACPTQEKFDWLCKKFPDAWGEAEVEVICKSINQVSQVDIIKSIKKRLNPHRPLVLIGGPPCQAYSLVGRARNSKLIKDNAEKWQFDKRRTLYKRYLYFIRQLQPDVFVMENVKGMLSATIEDELVFNKVRHDLKSIGGKYKLYSLVTDKDPESLEANDFIIQSENYGIPQKRHRVIILGVSKHITKCPSILSPKPEITVEECIGDLPKLRSSFSKKEKQYMDNAESWKSLVSSFLVKAGAGDGAVISEYTGGEWVLCNGNDGTLSTWYRPHKMSGVPNHASRSHIAKDIERYVHFATRAEEWGFSPKIGDLPIELLPDHRNVDILRGLTPKGHVNIAFSDRFRVQIRDEPSTTITSHISKDGHYYIHYDPAQARSLTVREAARLQTFPDDYRFEGTRTSQYHQVGNAVPPYLAYQIAEIVKGLLG
jgi:DNA (cytosine-5)-methyltransferase 1